MGRTESDRAIDSALSIFVVAIVIGAIGSVAAAGGQSMHMWLIRARGVSMGRASVYSWLWSWTGALGAAAAWGMVIGLWRTARTLAGGRAHRLATAALWTQVAGIVVAMSWQLAWSAIMARHAFRDVETVFRVVNIGQLGLRLLAAGLWLATLVALARATDTGARAPWAGRVLVAAAALLLDAGWYSYGYGRLMEWPLLDVAGAAVVAALHAGGMLALLVPVRRAWRSGPAPTADGPYREASAPEGSWRSSGELRLAGAGLAEVRRRVRALAIVTLVALPVFMVLAASRSDAGPHVALIFGAIQLGLSVPLARGLAGYSRAPHELPGRALGIGALLFTVGGLVASAKSLLALGAALAGWELGFVALGDSLGGAVASVIATVLVVVSLARAARGLGDVETRRRAWVVLAVYVATIGLAIGAFDLLLTSLERTVDLLPLLVLGAFLGGLLFMATYLWLLAAAARMPGLAPAADPPA